MNDQELLQSYAEALRYMCNAESTLQKAGKENNRYDDAKYVSTACGTAYKGVLIAFDAWLARKGAPMPTKRDKTKRHRSIDMYKKEVGKFDRKMLGDLNSAYNVLHLDGYYDGIADARIIRAGFAVAYEIIEKIKPAIADTEIQQYIDSYRKPSFLRKLYMLLI
ncbi:hypothetical protein FACS189452_07250 [Bacteroidia bacterium]|nr:hypothetical protein FACS189452_07250 [Bacteroidia bacterium]